jgi:hypothetical protein
MEGTEGTQEIEIPSTISATAKKVFGVDWKGPEPEPQSSLIPLPTHQQLPFPHLPVPPMTPPAKNKCLSDLNFDTG